MAEARAAAESERLRIQEQAKVEQAEIDKAQQARELPAPLAQDLSALVSENAVEAVAAIDAQQVIAAAKTGVTASKEGESLKLGQVNTMLKDAGLGQISAETLEVNEIAFTKERGAVLVQASDVQRLLIKMAMGMRKLADELTASA